MKNLTILSYGAGQDSTAILYKIIYDTEFRKKYVNGDLLVVFADTKNEHNETYEHIEFTKTLCKNHNIEFIVLDPEKDNYTSKSWSKGYIYFLESHNAIGSKAFPKTCTDKLKITPIYNYLEQYVHTVYKTLKVGRKAAIKEFTTKNGKINVLIGIARNEEKRISKNSDSPQKWMRECINKVYPLIDLKMNRQDCQNYITSVGHEIPLPSNYILCPFMDLQELLYLYLSNPNWYYKWVELEQNKINNNLHKGSSNLGVWGKKLLPEKLIEAKEKFKHLTIEDLKIHKMSHGHCLMSKY